MLVGFTTTCAISAYDN